MITSANHWLTFARGLQKTATEAGLGPKQRRADEPISLFDALITHSDLRSATRTLFSTGHYADAVRRGFICLDNAVRDKSGVSSKTGDSLMRTAFSANKPLLRLNDFLTDSDRNEQHGYMDLYAGSMRGIRNPRAHEAKVKDDCETALELLTLANHLMRRLDCAVVSESGS